MAAPIRTSRLARLLPGIVLATLLLAGTAQAQSGEVYQWKDAKGVTHFSDAPPPKGKFESRVIDQHPATPAVADNGSQPPTADAEATSPESRRARAEANAAKGQANCTLARTNLSRLQAAGDIGLDADGDGKPDNTLDAEQRAKQTQLAQANIQSFCAQTDAAASP